MYLQNNMGNLGTCGCVQLRTQDVKGGHLDVSVGDNLGRHATNCSKQLLLSCNPFLGHPFQKLCRILWLCIAFRCCFFAVRNAGMHD